MSALAGAGAAGGAGQHSTQRTATGRLRRSEWRSSFSATGLGVAAQPRRWAGPEARDWNAAATAFNDHA